MLQQAPTAPPLPPLPQTPAVTIAAAPLTSPQSVYQAFRAQRRELGNQLDALESQRNDISSELAVEGIAAADAKGLEARLAAVDDRISAVDKQIAEANAQVARAASIPGAAVDPPERPQSGPPEEFWVLSGMMIVFVFLPLSIAYARRIWRRSARIITAFPQELSDRLNRVEQTVEATAVEVERIGEGQRFMTKLFTESGAGAFASQPPQRIPLQSGGPPAP